MNPSRKRILWYLLGVIFAGFILLTAIIYFLPVSIVDKEVSEEIQEHHYPILDIIMKFISFFGYYYVSLPLTIATAAIFFFCKYRREALFILFTLLSGVISASLKIFINRPRPTGNLVRIVEQAKNRSFPSGHVTFYVIFFGFIALLMYHLKNIPKKLRIAVASFCFFLIFSVPISRVYLGAHWFSDVLGGFLLGMICLYVIGIQYFKD